MKKRQEKETDQSKSTKKNNQPKTVNMSVDGIWKRHTSYVMIKRTFDNY